MSASRPRRAQSPDPTPALDDVDRDALLRWRLALGPEAERLDPHLSLGELGAAAGELALDPRRLGALDKALSFVYDGRSAGLNDPRPYIPEWLAALRELFSHEVVALVQQDAIEKKGLAQLLFEPEALPFLEKNVELVATLMSAKGFIPDAARDTARQIVREVVEDVKRALEAETRAAILGALRRGTTSPLRVMRNLDWKRTIQRNLKGWDAQRRRLVPEKLYFWANQQRRHAWDVAILVDQSGSMGESVVYSSIMAAIFASLDVLRTRLLFFDTEVVDMTPMLVDPVEVLFTAQLGGGTDINRAVAYAQANFIERPEKTLLLLITDLHEGGDKEELVARMRKLADSKVKSVCLLALSDSGKPSYDHELAGRLAALGTPCFGCTPKLLVQVMERIMRGQDLGPVLGEAGER